MKQNEIQTLQKIKSENLENIFNIYKDSNNKYFYNLLQTVEIPVNLPDGYFSFYTVTHGDVWPTISYKAYNTPNLWWVIMCANNIIDPTKLPIPGDVIKILNSEIVQVILEQTSSQAN